MEHFYQDIVGMTTFENLYAEMAARFPSGSRFVEIGVFAGRSWCYMGVEIVNQHKDIEWIALDNWGWHYEEFLKNAHRFDGKLNWRHIKDDHRQSVNKFADKSIDFAFLDAHHGYKEVLGDLVVWTPKIKSGGVFAGHDYNDTTIHGVNRAVNEFFGDKFKVIADQDCWLVEIA